MNRPALAAVSAGLLQIVVGLLQAFDENDTVPTLDPVEHVVLALYAAALVLLVPSYLALARHARGRRGARAAAVGMALLAFGMTTTNLNDQDLGWFWMVAAPSNALWLFGTIALAVSLFRAGRVARWVSLGVVLTWVGGIPLSQLGGAVLPGAYWLAVGALLAAGTLSQAERAVPDAVRV